MQKTSAGKFQVEPPSRFTSFNHLVGGDEQLVGHAQPQSPCGLVVDDELELRGLQDRQIARLRALENPASVDAGLTISVPNVGSIADQSTDLGIFTPGIDRRQPVVGCKLDQLNTPTIEEGIVADEEGVRSFGCKPCNCRVDLPAGAGAQELDLQLHRAGGGFDVSQGGLEGISAGRVGEGSHDGSLRYKLAQQFQLLGHQFGIVKVDTRQVSFRPRETLDQTEPHRVFGDDEYDGDGRGRPFCSEHGGDTSARNDGADASAN